MACAIDLFLGFCIMEDKKGVLSMTKEEVLQTLETLGITYTKVDHEAIETMDGLDKVEKQLNHRVAKNLFLTNRQKTRFYLLLTVGDKKFKTKELSHQINSARLSFGSGEDMERLLGCHPGSASILGLLNDQEGKVQLLIDEDLLQDDYICAHPCFNTSTLKMKKDGVITIFLPYVKHDYIAVKLIGE